MSAETAIINGLLTMVCVLNNKSAGRDTTAHAFIREPFVFWLEKKNNSAIEGHGRLVEPFLRSVLFCEIKTKLGLLLIT